MPRVCSGSVDEQELAVRKRPAFVIQRLPEIPKIPKNSVAHLDKRFDRVIALRHRPEESRQL